MKYKISAIIILIIALALGYFVYSTENPDSKYAFKFGLDLSGGTHLVYQADTSELSGAEATEAMTALRNAIERRVNVFGVSEPVVQTERGGIAGDHRLIVELPGVTDVDEATALIGRTPLLEFKLLLEENVPTDNPEAPLTSDMFTDTGLTGSLLESAQVSFGQGQGGVGVSEVAVLIDFNKEGRELFAQITRDNVGEVLAIFLDGQILSLPVIQTEIIDGSAQITGSFTPEGARELARDLNLGALPVPISLISTQSIGASLGHDALDAGVKAGIYGLIALALFLILWYRLPGVLAVVALGTYLVLTLALFKAIPVVLTAAGIAGFILSIGMAVDANVLIFERMKEELRKGEKSIEGAVRTGFSRAWLSIRDGNISSIITAVILFWFGTSLVKGFALTFGLGVLFSMLSAITVSRTFLLAMAGEGKNEGARKFLFGTGLK